MGLTKKCSVQLLLSELLMSLQTTQRRHVVVGEYKGEGHLLVAFFFFFRLLDSVSEFVIQILLEMESLTLQYISDKTI